eukprot:361899_1
MIIQQLTLTLGIWCGQIIMEDVFYFVITLNISHINILFMFLLVKLITLEYVVLNLIIYQQNMGVRELRVFMSWWEFLDESYYFFNLYLNVLMKGEDYCEFLIMNISEMYESMCGNFLFLECNSYSSRCSFNSKTTLLYLPLISLFYAAFVDLSLIEVSYLFIPL